MRRLERFAKACHSKTRHSETLAADDEGVLATGRLAENNHLA